MVDEPPSAVWAIDHIRIGRSPIAGQGLFAGDNIRAGTVVLRLGGRLVTTTELDALIDEANTADQYVDTTTVFDDAHLVLPADTIIHFANHSCDPNLRHEDAYDVVARRDITAGEELTIDYGTNSGAPGFAMSCSCGASDCRGQVTSDDWRIADLQRRYAGHWVPALARRIDTSNRQ